MDISFHSQNSENSPTKKQSQLLCSEIEQGGLNGWKDYSVDLSDDEKNQQISEQNQQKAQPLSTQNIQEKKEEELEEKIIDENCEQGEFSEPKTITLIEDTGMSKDTGVFSSKLSQYNSSITNQSYSSFMHMKETVYEVHRRNYEELFQKTKENFCRRILVMEETYVTFLKVKFQQERLFAEMCIEKQKSKKNQEKQISTTIYINCKSVLHEVKRKNKQQCDKVLQFSLKIQEKYKRIQNLFQEINVALKKKISSIETLIEKLNQISEEMNTIITSKQKKSHDRFHGNTYVISKYLIKKEQSYLDLLSIFTREIINFVNLICRQVEPKISVTLKQILISYMEIVGEFKPNDKAKYENLLEKLIEINCFQTVYKEIVDILLECIPQSLLKIKKKKPQLSNDNFLQYIIEKLNEDAQSLIFLQCIEIDQENWIYSSDDKVRVKWIKAIEGDKSLQKQVDIHLLLTKQGHMVLQIKKNDENADDYIATIRLSDVKLSKKDNRIILTDKGKGVIGMLLSSNSVLGQLIFQPMGKMKKNFSKEKNQESVEEFIEKVKQLLKEKKTMKN